MPGPGLFFQRALCGKLYYNIGDINGQFSLGQLELSPSLISSLRGHNTSILKGHRKDKGALPPRAGRPPIKGRRVSCGHICDQCLTAKALRVKQISNCFSKRASWVFLNGEAYYLKGLIKQAGGRTFHVINCSPKGQGHKHSDKSPYLSRAQG